MYQDNIHLTLARNLKRIRKQLKITQMELATRSGVSTSFIGEIEIGRKYPSADTLQKISNSLGVRPYQLFLENEDWQVKENLGSLFNMYKYLKKEINDLLDEGVKRFNR